MKKMILVVVSLVATCFILAGCEVDDGMQAVEGESYTFRIPAEWSVGAQIGPDSIAIFDENGDFILMATETTEEKAPSGDASRIETITSEESESLDRDIHRFTEAANIGDSENNGYPAITESVIITTEREGELFTYDQSWEYEIRYACWVDDDTWVRLRFIFGDDPGGSEELFLVDKIAKTIEPK